MKVRSLTLVPLFVAMLFAFTGCASTDKQAGPPQEKNQQYAAQHAGILGRSGRNGRDDESTALLTVGG